MDKRLSRRLVLFFILALLLPWAVWGTSILESKGVLSFHIPQSLAFWLGLPLATFGAILFTGEKVLIKDLFQKLILWKVPLRWYFLAVGLTGFICLSSIVVLKFSGFSSPIIPSKFLSWNTIGLLFFQIFFFLLTEELAWRGFALPSLLTRFNLFYSSIILGVFWGVWHLSLFLIPGSFQSTIPFSGFVLSAICMSVLIGWIFSHTNGSVLLAAIFHASTDLTIATTGIMGSPGGFWVFVVIQLIFSILVVWFDRSSFFQVSLLKTNGSTSYEIDQIQS